MLVFRKEERPGEQPLQTQAKGNAGTGKSISELAELIHNRKFFIPKDRLTPVPEKRWLEQLKAELNIFDPKELKRKIREEVGYEFEGMLDYLKIPREAAGNAGRLYLYLADSLAEIREKVDHYSRETDAEQSVANLKQVEKSIKVELAITLLEIAYEKADRRKSGHERITHPLRAGLFAAAIGAPVDYVITALLHDILEDTRDKRHKGISYAVPYYEGNAIEGVGYREFFLDKEKCAHLSELFGKQVAMDIMRLTRDPESRKAIEDAWGGREKRAYKKYLDRAHGSIGATFAKAMDGIVNFWELDFEDKALEAGMRQRTVDKAAMQIPFLRKMSWLITYMLVEGIEQYSPDKMLAVELLSFSEKDVRSFERGVKNAGRRRFERTLLAQVPDNGAPIAVIFRMMKYREIFRKSKRFEVEMPYLDAEKQIHLEAGDRLIGAFGSSVSNIGPAHTLLIPRLRKALLRRFEAGLGDVKGNLDTFGREYCNEIAGELLIYGISDRETHAEGLRKSRYYRPNIRKAKEGIPPRGSAASQGLPGQPGQEELKDFPTQAMREGKILPAGSFFRHFAGG